MEENKVTNWTAVANFVSDALDCFEDEDIYVVFLRKDLECLFEKFIALSNLGYSQR